MNHSVNGLPFLVHITIGLIAAGCGSNKLVKSSRAGGADTPSSPPHAANVTLSTLEVLSPGELAMKIYNSFGPGMTLSGKPGDRIDYLNANAAEFVGSISNDPNNMYASSFTVSYFIALAGLAEVVGTNYSAALAQGAAVHDCRQSSGAQLILQGVAPTITSEQLADIGATMVAACNKDAASAVSAVVQSYSTALKTAL